VSSRLDVRKIIFRLGFAAIPLPSDEIAAYTGIDKKLISNFLKRASRKGYVQRLGKSYVVTDKGLSLVKRKLYRKIHRILYGGSSIKKFRFFKRGGEPTGVEVRSLKELVEVFKSIGPSSLMFHFEKHDIHRWLGEELEDDFLVFLINKSIRADIDAHDLHDALYGLLSSRLDSLLALEKKLIELK